MSFCISCGITLQTIADNDKCVAIPVMQKRTFERVQLQYHDESFEMFGVADTPTSPSSFWAPYGAVVTGTYADCGYILPDDTSTNRKAMVGLFRELLAGSAVTLAVAGRRDESYDIQAFMKENAKELLQFMDEGAQVDVAVLSFYELVSVWRYVWLAAFRYRLFARDALGQFRPMVFSVMHAVTFDYLVTFAELQPKWNEVSYRLEEFLKSAIDETTVILAKLELKEEKARHLVQCAEILSRLTMSVGEGARMMFRPFEAEMSGLIQAHLEGCLCYDKLVDALTPMLAGTYALKAMAELQFKFTPIAYASQDYENLQGQAVAKFISTISADVTRQREQNFEE